MEGSCEHGCKLDGPQFLKIQEKSLALGISAPYNPFYEDVENRGSPR
ncbi:hypothetical protein J3R74_003912 [Puniceicoccus vermicola]